jgi:hypothetical protein
MLDYDDPDVVFGHEGPVPFRGGIGEADENYKTHLFVFDGTWDGDARCAQCDVGPWMASAYWPCGEFVPRRRVTHLSDDSVVYDTEYAPGKWTSEIGV